MDFEVDAFGVPLGRALDCVSSPLVTRANDSDILVVFVVLVVGLVVVFIAEEHHFFVAHEAVTLASPRGGALRTLGLLLAFPRGLLGLDQELLQLERFLCLIFIFLRRITSVGSAVRVRVVRVGAFGRGRGRSD